MIGCVEVAIEGRPLVAVLNADGFWSCAEISAIAERLNREFSPIGRPSASGNWGHWEIIAAARALGGVPRFGETNSGPLSDGPSAIGRHRHA